MSKAFKNLNDIENIEILLDLVNRVNMIKDIINEQKMIIIRTVEPDNDEFQCVHEKVNQLVNQKITKKKNSEHLISTQQYLRIMYEDKVEESKVKILMYSSDEINKILRNSFNREQALKLKNIYSDKLSYQNILLNSKFLPTSFNSDINELINEITFQVKVNDTDLKFKFLEENKCNVTFLKRIFNIEEFFNQCNDLDDFSNKSTKQINDYINSLDLNFLVEATSKFVKNLKIIEDLCDDYFKEITISYKTFSNVFPEVDAFLELRNKEINDELIYASKLIRKKIKVEITYETEVEIEVIDDDEIVSKINTYLNSDKKLIPSCVYGDDFKIISSNLNKINIL